MKKMKSLKTNNGIMKINIIIEIYTSGLLLSGPPPVWMEWFKSNSALLICFIYKTAVGVNNMLVVVVSCGQ